MTLLRNQTIADALTEARDTYAAARPKARAMHAVAAKSMPGGNTRTTLHHGPFPIRVASGEGATLTDIDGHRYVNLLGEYTAGVFGASHPVIRKAIDRALDGGVNFGANGTAEPELARLVCERFHSIERVRFTNSGTEANLMAISTARYVTKRSKVMVMHSGYHGALLYFGGGGIPINAPFPYVIARYNDLEVTRALIRAEAEELACVVVEAMLGSTGCVPATPEFLAMLREETQKAGALLILDEVMTSRFGSGGAQGLYGLKPDFTTLGKWIGGGMTFGGFGGRADLMDIYDPTKRDAMPHAGTFNNNVLTMSAGVAAMRDVFPGPVALALHERGNHLRTRLNELFAQRDVGLQITGLGSLMNLHATTVRITRPEDLATNDEKLRELVYFDLLDRGFYLGRRGFMALSLPLTDRDLDGLIEALDDIITTRRAVLPRRSL